MMIAFSVAFFGMFVFAVVFASAIAIAKTIVHRHKCYKRAAMRSLVRSVKRAAIARYYGRV